jgi:hypothetical protein
MTCAFPKMVRPAYRAYTSLLTQTLRIGSRAA